MRKLVRGIGMEGANLSSRMGMRRLTPLTNSFKSKLENYMQTVSIYFMVLQLYKNSHEPSKQPGGSVGAGIPHRPGDACKFGLELLACAGVQH